MSTFQSLYALPRRYMEMGITNAPMPISVAVRVIRRYVLRLRKVGLVKKTTMVKVFSVMLQLQTLNTMRIPRPVQINSVRLGFILYSGQAVVNNTKIYIEVHVPTPRYYGL